MQRSIWLAAMIALAPCAALAADASVNAQVSGKPADGKVDGKTEGMSEKSAEKIGQQQKAPPKTSAEAPGDAQPAKAGTGEASSVKSP